MNVAKNTVVSMNYQLTDGEGNQLDSSDVNGPLSYVHGVGTMLPALEQELEGKEPGEKIEAVLQPEDAYGERNEDLVQNLPMEKFQGVDTVEPGMQFQMETEEGQFIVTVTDVQGDEVTIDQNHPLAGTELHFDIAINEVREATETEIEHGHVHEEGSENEE